MKKMTSSLVAALFVCVCGCRDKNLDVERIEGVVCASRADILGSYLLKITARCDDDCDPLPNAKIELAFDEFDEKGSNRIKGFEATSDGKGQYTMSLKGIPRSPTEYGND